MRPTTSIPNKIKMNLKQIDTNVLLSEINQRLKGESKESMYSYDIDENKLLRYAGKLHDGPLKRPQSVSRPGHSRKATRLRNMIDS